MFSSPVSSKTLAATTDKLRECKARSINFGLQELSSLMSAEEEISRIFERKAPSNGSLAYNRSAHIIPVLRPLNPHCKNLNSDILSDFSVNSSKISTHKLLSK